MKDVLAVDRGATWTRAVVGGEEGFHHEPVKIESVHSLSEFRDFLERVVEEYSAWEDIEAIGIGTPGIVDPEEKKMKRSANLPEMDFSPLEGELGIPVNLENDANVAVIGEKFYGSGSGYDNLVHITIGSGVGAGVFYDGELLRSTGRGGPAEVGFFTVDYDGTEENFGKQGVWEAYVSGINLTEFVKTLLDDDSRETQLRDIEDLDPEDLFQLAHEGDEVSQSYLERIGRINAAGFANVVNAFNPEMITIGGAVALNNPDFMNQVIEVVEEHLEDHAINPAPEFEITDLGDDIGLYGGLALARIGKDKL